MSIKVMTLVWEHYPVGEGEMLLALALADWAPMTEAASGQAWQEWQRKPGLGRGPSNTRSER